MNILAASILLCICLCVVPAWAQTPDTILINGKILTVDSVFSVREALSVHDGKILSVGTSSDIRKTAGPRTQVIDLQGRTVIPGLIDSHIHAIRAGLTYSSEVNWVGVPSITEAMNRIHQAAAAMKPGAWLIVGGGWTTNQFKERRRPTQVELEAAAPNNPIYVQLGYSWAILSRSGLKLLNISSDADLPSGARSEKDSNGNLTGGISGSQTAIVALYDKLPRPTYEQELDGTTKFFRELNRLGMTGVGDPGGANLPPSEYRAVFNVWQQHQMTIRVAYWLNAQTAGSEFEEFQNLTRMLPGGFGDDLLRFNGIGERITWGMYNNDAPSDADKAKYYEIAKWAAERGMSLTVHWNNNASVDQLLTLYERLDREVPITGLRWSIAHLNDASAASLARMKALGLGWTMQDMLYFSEDTNRVLPPVMTAKKLGVPVGAGTDAHRVASYNPFTCLQWLLDGKTVGGAALRRNDDAPHREDALRFYTMGSAWFSRQEDRLGSLETGKLADLSVLSKDYMTAPVEQVGGIESLLTMVGGKIVYAAGPYQKLEDRKP